MEDSAKENTSREDEILKTAHKRFQLCEESQTKIREDALDDLKFRKGDQWPDDIRQNRRTNGRPCLTINKMPQFTRQIINDQKQNRPGIKVHPVDEYADKDTAKVLQGMIRNIERQSNAEECYDTAFESAANGSFGFFEVYTEYEDEKSFNQELRIGKIENPFNVYLDPYHSRIDGSDSNYGFIVDTMTKDEFEAEYGKTKLSEHSDWGSLAKDHRGWIGPDEIRIVKYYYKDFDRKKIYLLEDGKVYFKDEIELSDQKDFVFVNGQPLKIINTRYTKICSVRIVKMNAIEILEETEWPSRYIPIIPVYGDRLNIDGEIVLESIIRHSKDSQRMVNFWASSEAEAITLAPKAPFIGYEGQFEGHENAWARSNTDNLPYLEVKPTTLDDGTAAPLPQRNAFEPPVMAITQARALANQDVRETTGVPDAARGLSSNEASGIAIRNRVTQGLTSNFHLVDNLNKSIAHCGLILIEMIPKIYDAPRTIRILGERDEEEIIKINAVIDLPKNQKRAYNFSYGKYDVSSQTGPSYETRRQEARDSMLEMIRYNPQFATIAGDLLVQNMDWPGADEFAERIRKTMDPNLITKGDEEIPPAIAQKMQQMTQMIEQLTAQLNQSKEIIDKDLLQIESKERIESMKIKADLEKELIKIKGSESEIILKQQIEMLNKRLDELNMGSPVSASVEMEMPGNNGEVELEY